MAAEEQEEVVSAGGWVQVMLGFYTGCAVGVHGATRSFGLRKQMLQWLSKLGYEKDVG